MISYLIGSPRILESEVILITSSGVGYQVFLTNGHISNLSGKDQTEFFVYTHVKEDALELYGFETIASKKLFKLLISVSGVGPKTALGVLDKGSNNIVEAVQQANTAFFSSVPRIGKKSAQKIIIELRSKLGEVNQLDLTPLSKNAQEAHDALVALGFDAMSVDAAVSDIDFDDISLQAGIKLAIKKLGKK